MSAPINDGGPAFWNKGPALGGGGTTKPRLLCAGTLLVLVGWFLLPADKPDTSDYYTYYSWTKLTGRHEITFEEWKLLKTAGFLHNNARYE